MAGPFFRYYNQLHVCFFVFVCLCVHVLGIKSFLTREGIPVDHLEIRGHIPRDRRHRSKPDTAALFQRSNPNSPFKIIVFLLKSNPFKALLVIFVQIILIMLVLGVIISSQ